MYTHPSNPDQAGIVATLLPQERNGGARKRRATFLISLDCEGNWGSAALPSAMRWSPFVNSELLAVTGGIVDMLDTFGLRATFAIVGAYMMSAEHFLDSCASLPHLRMANVTRNLQNHWRSGHWEGWFNPEIQNTISERHEIAGHGFSHRLLGSEVPRAIVREELEALATLQPFKLRKWTLVYPWNAVGHTEELSACGIIGYRRNRRVSGLAQITSRLRVPGIEGHPPQTGRVIPIPGGHFFHWRWGIRRAMPARLVEEQWRAALKRVVHVGGVLHLWAHPENFLTGPAGLPVLRRVLREASELVSNGDLWNPTMIEYCQQQGGQTSRA